MDISEQFPTIRRNEPLSHHSTFQVGGPANLFYEVHEMQELPKLIHAAQHTQIPYVVLGGGSNVLFDDKGFRGLVIRIKAKNCMVTGTQMEADAGMTVAQLIAESIRHHLTGLEAWVGLPGTVGGAVRGNAGCNGVETKDILVSAQLLDPESGRIHEEEAEYFKYEYRNSSVKKNDEIVLSARFQLQSTTLTPEEQRELMGKIRAQRVASQPVGAGAGSFFKNPSVEHPAGLLVEQAGLKGLKIGNAQISEKHGNFILNLGKATAADIIALARHAQKTIKERYHITLKEEVQLYSEYGKTSL